MVTCRRPEGLCSACVTKKADVYISLSPEASNHSQSFSLCTDCREELNIKVQEYLKKT